MKTLNPCIFVALFRFLRYPVSAIRYSIALIPPALVKPVFYLDKYDNIDKIVSGKVVKRIENAHD